MIIMNLLGKMIGTGNRNGYRPDGILGFISEVSTIHKMTDYLLDVCPESDIYSIEIMFSDGMSASVWPFIHPFIHDHNLGIITESGWIPLWEVI